MKPDTEIGTLAVTPAIPEFNQLLSEYQASPAWQQERCTLIQSIKNSTIPGDIEGKRSHLRQLKSSLQEQFQKFEYYNIWSNCADSDGNTDYPRFLQCINIIKRSVSIDDLITPLCFISKCQFIDSLFPADNAHHSSPAASDRVDIICPFSNDIFRKNIFRTDNHLALLYDAIAASIDMGHQNLPSHNSRHKINPHINYEWFYILHAINDAAILNKISLTAFIEEMMQWFPSLFPSFESPSERKQFIARLYKSISHEKTVWRDSIGYLCPVSDMWNSYRSLNINQQKACRLIPVTQELRSALIRLKTDLTHKPLH